MRLSSFFIYTLLLAFFLTCGIACGSARGSVASSDVATTSGEASFASKSSFQDLSAEKSLSAVRDSVLVRDTVRQFFRGDTVFIEKARHVTKTLFTSDTVSMIRYIKAVRTVVIEKSIFTTRTVTQSVTKREIPPWCFFITALASLVAILSAALAIRTRLRSKA